MILLVALIACDDSITRPFSSKNGDSQPTTGAGSGTLMLPNHCEPPADLPVDPLVLDREYFFPADPPGTLLVELVDIAVEGDLVYAVGQGGLMLFDTATAELRGTVGTGGPGRFHRVEVIGDGYVAVSHRDIGVRVVDVSNPDMPFEVWSREDRGLEGLAVVGDRLYVSARGAGVQVLDIGDPGSPTDAGTGGELEAPWELVAVGEDWLYAADNVLGVVPIDLADPDSPLVGDPVSLDGAVLHVATDGTYLFVSNGGNGVVIMDLSNPAAPVEISRAVTGGSVLMSAVDGTTLWTADHESVMAFDISDIRAPLPIGREEVRQYALAVDAEDGIGWVGDWGYVEGWIATPGGGELDAPDDTVWLPEAGGSAELRLTNRGAGDLLLSGATVDDSRVSVRASSDVILPGESATS